MDRMVVMGKGERKARQGRWETLDLLEKLELKREMKESEVIKEEKEKR